VLDMRRLITELADGHLQCGRQQCADRKTRFYS